MDQDSLTSCLPISFKLMRRLSQRQLTKSSKIRLGKEVLQGLPRLLRMVNDTSFQAMQKSARSHVDHHNFIRLFENPVGKGLAWADACDLPHLVIEAFDVLHVESSPNIDA